MVFAEENLKSASLKWVKNSLQPIIFPYCPCCVESDTLGVKPQNNLRNPATLGTRIKTFI